MVTGLAAALPVIVATVRAVREGWIPAADEGIIATRAYDVFTSHAPLVGQYSYAGHVTGKVTYSLGPMLYWLIAPAAHFGSPASITWTMALVNILAILGVVALARRRGGIVLMFATALALTLMCQSLAAETLHDIWNPSAGLFPFTLLIFLCWSLACGEYRLLPLVVLDASYVLQANLMYVPPTLGLLAVGLGGLLLARVLTGRRLAIWGGACFVIVAFFWSAPLIDQLTSRHGNISDVIESATASKATLGATIGWHAVVRAIGVKPWWLHVQPDRWRREWDVLARPAARAVISCVVLLTALVVVVILGLRRGRRDLAAGALIGLVLCFALASIAASTPTPPLLQRTLGYTMWWGSQLGMWVWLMLAWSAWLTGGWALRTLRARRQCREALGTAARPARQRCLGVPISVPLLTEIVASIVGVGAIAAMAGVVAAGGRPDEGHLVYRPSAVLAASAEKAIPRGRTVDLVTHLGYATMVVRPALRYLLTRHGVRPLAVGSGGRSGEWYELDKRPFQYFLYVEDGRASPARGARLLRIVTVFNQTGPHPVSLWVARHQ